MTADISTTRPTRSGRRRRPAAPLVALAFAALLLSACQSAAPGAPGDPDPDPPADNRPPEASASAAPTSGPAPLTVAFDASGSTDPDGGELTFAWDFGDGSSASGAAAQHTYAAGGWTATLTVTDEAGARASRSVAITATGAGDDPPADEPPGDEPPGDEPPGDPDDPPAEPTGPSAERVAAGVTIGDEVQALQEEATVGAVEAVATATGLGGGAQLVTSGTLTLDPSAPQGVRYDPEPSDRLRVVGPDGSVAFAFGAFEGDLGAPDVDAFLRGPHRLAFRLTTSDGSDAEVASVRTGSSGGGASGGLLRGTVVVGGAEVAVDLAGEGTFTASADSGAAEYESSEALQGTVAATGLSVAVNERREFRYFQFENAVEIRRRSIDNRWTVDGVEYRLADGFIKRNFVCADGVGCGPDELDLWAAQGTLTRDGTPIGGIGLVETPFAFETVLQIGAERVVLYSDTKVAD